MVCWKVFPSNRLSDFIIMIDNSICLLNSTTTAIKKTKQN